MTTSPEPDLPWLQPTGELPAQPRDRRRLVMLSLPVVGLLVLCCGGSLLVTSVFRGGSPKSSAPTLTAPSSAEPPSPTAAPGPTPTEPVMSKISTTPPTTTHRPTPTATRPTTTNPQPSPPATSGIIQQNVRLGALCSPPGAIGVTKRGRLLRCGPGPDDPRSRWRPMV